MKKKLQNEKQKLNVKLGIFTYLENQSLLMELELNPIGVLLLLLLLWLC